MIKESKAVAIINCYLDNAHESVKARFYPVSFSSLVNDAELCDELIDYLGDIYVCSGLDNNYEENSCGAELQSVIQFLAFCRGNTD